MITVNIFTSYRPAPAAVDRRDFLDAVMREIAHIDRYRDISPLMIKWIYDNNIKCNMTDEQDIYAKDCSIDIEFENSEDATAFKLRFGL